MTPGSTALSKAVPAGSMVVFEKRRTPKRRLLIIQKLLPLSPFPEVVEPSQNGARDWENIVDFQYFYVDFSNFNFAAIHF